MTRWTVSPSLMPCWLRLSPSFKIFPAKIRTNWSCLALNRLDISSLNYKRRRLWLDHGKRGKVRKRLHFSIGAFIHFCSVDIIRCLRSLLQENPLYISWAQHTKSVKSLWPFDSSRDSSLLKRSHLEQTCSMVPSPVRYRVYVSGRYVIDAQGVWSRHLPNQTTTTLQFNFPTKVALEPTWHTSISLPAIRWHFRKNIII